MFWLKCQRFEFFCLSLPLDEVLSSREEEEQNEKEQDKELTRLTWPPGFPVFCNLGNSTWPQIPDMSTLFGFLVNKVAVPLHKAA